MVRTFGTFRVQRSDGAPVGAAWHKRDRVRQIFARLLAGDTVNRRELAAQLWPDLPPDKALANLRVNLNHLHAALQPDRTDDEPPWFVRVTPDTVALTSEGLRIDALEFDRHVRRAVEAEAAGLPSVALSEYVAACELFTGDYLLEFDDEQVDLERLRLRTLAQAAQCRRGELTLARGEPELAMRAAAEALRLDALCERAHRLFLRCQVAVGSLSTARAAGERLLRTLDRAGLRPDDETTLLLRRLQVAEPTSPGDL
jgi:DNA-binding SARP family transcriptional activator